MSAPLFHYGKMIFTAAVDLWTGVTIGVISNWIFGKAYSETPEKEEEKTMHWIKNVTLCTLQAGLSLIAAESIRTTFFPPDFNDPTGGVVFTVAVFLPQSLLWKYSTLSFAKIYPMAISYLDKFKS